jgi:hypothetical protein
MRTTEGKDNSEIRMNPVFIFIFKFWNDFQVLYAQTFWVICDFFLYDYHSTCTLNFLLLVRLCKFCLSYLDVNYIRQQRYQI